jgi:type IV secretory pathway VirB3-like protein
MNEEYRLEIDPLALNLTKPAMMLGIPLMLFYVSIMVCFLMGSIFAAISGGLSIAIVIIICAIWGICYFCMMYLSFNDAFGVSIFWIKLLHFRKSVSFRFWNNTDSYAI